MNTETFNTIAFIFLFIICVGIVGNLLNIVVFSRKSMRSSTTFRFLLYLAVFDLLILVNCVLDGMLTFIFELELRLTSTFMCQFHTFFTYFLTHLSSVILMTVNIERAIVVRRVTFKKIFRLASKKKKKKKKKKGEMEEEKPTHKQNQKEVEKVKKNMRIYKAKRFVKNNRVDIVMLFVILGLILVNAHFLFNLSINEKQVENSNKTISSISFTYQNPNDSLVDSDVQTRSLNVLYLPVTANQSLYYKICFPKSTSSYYYFLKNVWVWIDISIYSLIPFVCMAFCSTIILIKINRQLKQLKNSKNTNKMIAVQRKKRNTQTLIMLIATNLYFVICSLPYSISYNLFNKEESDGPDFVQSLIQVLAYSNNACNFIFYGILSEKYRKEFKCLFKFHNTRENNNRDIVHVKNENESSTAL